MPEAISDGRLNLIRALLDTREEAEAYCSGHPNWIIKDHGVELNTNDPPYWKKIDGKFSVWF